VLGAPTLLCGTLLKAHAMKKETMAGWLILSITPIVFVPLFGWFFGIKGIVITRGLTNGLVSGYYFWCLNRLMKKN
jgi:cellobiose-specific phosphotransferase system component IIC